MKASVRAFLNEIIDYAGLFPPAKLPLEDALRNYLRYKKESPYAWMLGRFVCPVAKLPELLTLAKGHPDGRLLQVSALGQQSANALEPAAKLDADIQAIETFRRLWGTDDVIDAFEVALAQGSDLDRLNVEPMARAVTQARLRSFVELPKHTNWRHELATLATLLKGLGIGLKLRTGGTQQQAFPADDEVAYFIEQCGRASLSWKSTAGLHHPCRHHDQGLHVWHHGFLNVFGAGLLAGANSLSRLNLTTILADRDGTSFWFDEQHFGWKDLSALTSEITTHRASFAISFGSCSFDEPIADLQEMGLLD